MLRTQFLPLLLAASILGVPSLAQSLPSRQLVIVCFGDSLTAGYGAMQGQSYPDFLESELIERGLHPRIVNEGSTGATTKDGISRLQAVVALHPDIAIVEFGANDGLRGMPVDTIVTNLDMIVRTLQQARVRVMLAGIYMPPNYGQDYVKQFDAIYPALAHKYKVPLLPFFLKDVYGVPGLVSNDGIHPNGMGYQVVARNVLTVLLPMLKKER